MVRIHPDPPGLGCVIINGGVAQLGEHLLCKQGVIGSIPIGSTNLCFSTGWDATKFSALRVSRWAAAQQRPAVLRGWAEPIFSRDEDISSPFGTFGFRLVVMRDLPASLTL